jgi:hypothetical protein
MSETATPAAPSLSRPHLAVALGVWAATTFGHTIGLEYAAALFAWGRAGKNWLSEAGGAVGMHRIELGLGSFFGAIALAVFANLAWKVYRLRPSRQDLVREATPWLIWATLTFLIWKCFIVYATELTHFAQYALVGFLVAWALGRGNKPQLAFLITFALGFTDELYQHYVLAAGNPLHFMDWSDPCLDAVGAAAGILPFVTLARLRGDVLVDTFRYVRRTVAISACVLLPLVLLNPVTTSWLLGHYHYDPFWGEYTNDKPTHWPKPSDGIPLLLSVLLILGVLLEPKRRAISQSTLAVLLALMVVAIQPPSRLKGMPVHEVVPHTLAHKTATPIVVDGVLEDAWKSAARIGPFLQNLDGKPARGATYARILWDPTHIYFAFEVEDDDVWARDTTHDDSTLPGDEVVEIFLDDGGDETTYFELEVSPKNVVQDLYCFVPRAPVDYNPDAPFRAMNAWDARGMRTAVHIDGTLDTVTHYGDSARKIDTDQGYVVEIALPWAAISPYPRSDVAHRDVPPKVGDSWRLGLYTLDRPRPDPSIKPTDRLSKSEAMTVLGLTDEADLEARVAATGLLRFDDAGTLNAIQVHYARSQERSWAPTQSVSFHIPRRFGVLQFAE